MVDADGTVDDTICSVTFEIKDKIVHWIGELLETI
jgi:hypothetical protein